MAHSMAHSMVGIMPPEKILGWEVHGKVETYNRETLYDYMNGAAEIYLTYDFRGLSVQRYIKPKSPDIVLEIFDMGFSEDAFGIFSHGQGREDKFSEKSLRYFHRHEILNYHYFVADKNILHLDRHTDALFVQYRDDKGYLLLVKYRDSNQAKKAYENFTDYEDRLDGRGTVVIK
jgi:hypothetical protein